MGKYNGMVYVYDEEESLAHYGIMGQKWGIRRFQNEDRTLTPEGKERYYGKSDSKQKKKNYERLVQINKETKNASDYANSFRRKAREIFTDDQIKRIAEARAQYKKDTKGLSENDHDNALADKIFTKPGGLNDVYSEVINDALGKYGHYNKLTGKGFSRRSLIQVLEDASRDYAKSNNEKLSKTAESEKIKIKDVAEDYMDFTYGKIKDKKRADLAAETGLNALKKLGKDIPDDASDDDKKDWFLYEDQTVGLPVIADLINRGYTSKQVGDLINEANDRDWASYDNPKESDLAFNLGETKHNSVGKKFAQACDETILESFVFNDGEGPHSDTIINRFEKMHGRGIALEEAKTKEGKKALDAFITARDEEANARREAIGLENPKKVKAFDKKPWTFPGDRYMKNPDYKKAKEQYDKAWRNYCEQVLKDMEMPVNDKTLYYVEYLLNWYN